MLLTDWTCLVITWRGRTEQSLINIGQLNNGRCRYLIISNHHSDSDLDNNVHLCFIVIGNNSTDDSDAKPHYIGTMLRVIGIGNSTNLNTGLLWSAHLLIEQMVRLLKYILVLLCFYADQLFEHLDWAIQRTWR